MSAAEEEAVLEVEYLLLALNLGEILFLLAGLGPLQAALLEVLEPCRHSGLRSPGWAGGVTGTLQVEGENGDV